MTDIHRPRGRPYHAQINDIDDALLGMEGLLFALHDLCSEPDWHGDRQLAISLLLGFLSAEFARADKALKQLQKGGA